MQTWLFPFAQKIPFIILDACEYHNTDEEGLPKIPVKSARTAILLIGGKKAVGRRWYDRYVPLAERIYENHLQMLKVEQGGAS